MRKNSVFKGRLVFGAIGTVNLCVLGMFIAILSPLPVPVQSKPVVTVSPKPITGQAFANINLGIPTRVVVESVAIDLPVRIGSYNPSNQTWTLDLESAFYADRSVPVNDSNGSTLIYAHARLGLFAKLPEITEGATARVYTDSGKVFSYSFASNRQVQPDDTSIFVNSGGPTLTLQTCSGPFDIYRTLVSFNLSGVVSV
jgi:LPXTG-site transpeptidase (sortase) family protein